MALPDLDALIAEVDRTCLSNDAVARLTAAADVAARLHAVGDDLVMEFVEQARFSNRSWAEIGAGLGVSRQAAQQRFLAPRIAYSGDQFAAELDSAMAAIKRQAVRRRHNFIGAEHVLLGLLSEPNSATAYLESAGADLTEIRRLLDSGLQLGASQAADRIAWTPYARKILDLAHQTAAKEEAAAIDCRHVLIGIMRLGRGAAAKSLEPFETASLVDPTGKEPSIPESFALISEVSGPNEICDDEG